MGARLHLCVASDHVRLDLLQPVRSTSVRMACRMFWAYLRGRDHAYYRAMASETVSGAINTATLLPIVQQALTQLERNSLKKLASSTLSVELGSNVARVGVLELDGPNAPHLAPGELQSYAHAWVTHTWGLEPADYVIRCTLLKNRRKYFLVCVDRFVPAQLSQMCLEKGLQFVDCKPALVMALSLQPVQAQKSMIVFMENATDGVVSRIAQFVALDESGPLSVSRIWLNSDDTVLQNSEVTQVVRRLCAQHQFQEPADIHRHAWPLPADVKARGGIT